MDKKILRTVLTAALGISLISNIALFWQLKEEQRVNSANLEKVAQKASQEAEKISSQRAAEVAHLKQAIEEKEETIAQLKDQEGLKAKEDINQAQVNAAEEFARVAIDKSIDPDESANRLKEIASQDVIQKLSPNEADHQHDTYESYSFTLGDVQTYMQPTIEEGRQNFVVFVDYTIGNPQFQDVKPQKIKGGVTLTEQQIEGKWQVTNFEYFTR